MTYSVFEKSKRERLIHAPGGLEKGSQVRQGAGRTVIEIGGSVRIQPERGRYCHGRILEEAGIRHTACAAARTVTVSTAVRIGWAILTGRVSVYAIVTGGLTTGIVYLPGCQFLTGLGSTTRPNCIRWQCNETSGKQKQYAQIRFHYSWSKVRYWKETPI